MKVTYSLLSICAVALYMGLPHEVKSHSSAKRALFDHCSPVTYPVAVAGDPGILQSSRICFHSTFNIDALFRETVPSWVVPLFDQEVAEIDFESFDRLGERRAVLKGVIKGQEQGWCLLALAGDAITGTLTLSPQKRYEVEYLGNGRHRLNEIDPGTMPRCGAEDHHAFDEDSFVDLAQAGSTLSHSDESPIRRRMLLDGEEEEMATVDTMIVYTTSVLESAGGPDGIQSLVDFAAAEANHVLENSKAKVRVNLVHHEALPYIESGSLSTDYNRFVGHNSGLDVRALRAKHGADLVTLLVEKDRFGWSGLATVLRKQDGDRNVFHSTIRRRWLSVGFYNYIHELSHNLGCQHDPRNARSSTGGVLPGVFPSSHGYRFEANDVTYVTAMGYPPGITLPIFSSSKSVFEGVATGHAEEADNVATLERIAPLVNAYETPLGWFELVNQNLSLTESESSEFELVVHRQGDSSSGASVTILMSPLEEGSQIQQATEVLEFAAGQSNQSVLFPLPDDSDAEVDEIVRFEITEVTEGFAIREGILDLKIVDDDRQVSVGEFSSVFYESGGLAEIPLIYRGEIGAGETVEVAYEVESLTASEGEDYQGSGGTVSFNADVLAATIQIPIVDDAVVEKEEEFEVRVGVEVVKVTILDDDRFGSLDSVFASAESVPNGVGWSIDIPNDSHLYIGGDFSKVGGLDRTSLARISVDGGVDPEFKGATFFAHKEPLGAAQRPRVLFVDTLPNGKVIAGGIFAGVDEHVQPNLVVLNSDGSFDETFRPEFDGAISNAMALPDGRIFVGGRFENVSGRAQNFIARLLPDGTNDPSFLPKPGPERFGGGVWGLALQADGKMLIGGFFTTVDGEPHSGVARINEDGTVDSGFHVPNGGVLGVVRMLRIIPDGRIYISGEISSVSRVQVGGIARLMPDGSLDRSFVVGNVFNRIVTAIQPLSDGRLIAVGEFTEVHGEKRSHVVLLNEDGSLDPSFDPGLGADDNIFALGVHGAGWLYLSGAFDHFAGRAVKKFARIRIAPTLPEIQGIGREADGLSLNLSGFPGSSFVLESSADLTEWQAAGSHRMRQSSLVLPIDGDERQAAQFFRLGASQ